MQKVKWKERYVPDANDRINFRDFDLTVFEEHFEGQLINTHKSFWGTPYGVVKLPDGSTKEVKLNKLQLVNSKNVQL